MNRIYRLVWKDLNRACGWSSPRSPELFGGVASIRRALRRTSAAYRARCPAWQSHYRRGGIPSRSAGASFKEQVANKGKSKSNSIKRAETAQRPRKIVNDR